GEQRLGARGLGRAGVAGGEDAAVHRGEVGGEQDGGTGDLLDLRRVAVVEEAVGGEVLVDGAERGGGLGRPAGSGHAARRVDDHAGGLHRAGAHERGEGERRSRRVAPGDGDVGGGGDV